MGATLKCWVQVVIGKGGLEWFGVYHRWFRASALILLSPTYARSESWAPSHLLMCPIYGDKGNTGLKRNKSFNRVCKTMTVDAVNGTLGASLSVWTQFGVRHWSVGSLNSSLLWQHEVGKEVVTASCNVIARTSPGLWRASTVSLSSCTQSLAQDLIHGDYSKMFAHWMNPG